VGPHGDAEAVGEQRGVGQRPTLVHLPHHLQRGMVLTTERKARMGLGIFSGMMLGISFGMG
jgi:hypothetical protein